MVFAVHPWTALGRGDDQTSHVPGEPIGPMPCSSTPAGPAYWAIGYADAAPAGSTTRAPAVGTFEAPSPGWGTRHLRFAGWIAPPPRKTRFSRRTSGLAKLCQAGFSPAGFHRKVSEMHFYLTAHPPLPSFVAQGPHTYFPPGCFFRPGFGGRTTRGTENQRESPGRGERARWWQRPSLPRARARMAPPSRDP